MSMTLYCLPGIFWRVFGNIGDPGGPAGGLLRSNCPLASDLGRAPTDDPRRGDGDARESGGCPQRSGADGLPFSVGPAEVSVNNRLRVLRAERGWSQGDLADRLGVSRQTVNAVETGKYDPSLPLAFSIARLFERSIEGIFDPEG